MINKKYALIAALLVVFVAITLSGEDAKPADVVTENTDSSRSVSLYKISADNGTAVRTADGSAFIVRSQSGGRVEKVAKVGDVVVAGATIAQI